VIKSAYRLVQKLKRIFSAYGVGYPVYQPVPVPVYQPVPIYPPPIYPSFGYGRKKTPKIPSSNSASFPFFQQLFRLSMDLVLATEDMDTAVDSTVDYHTF
jgi:hypothetical protein